MYQKENGKFATTFELPPDLARDLEEAAQEHPEDSKASIIRMGLRKELQRREIHD